MSGSITYNPMVTSNAAGSFSVYSDGYTVGVMMDDPAVRYAIAGGVLNTTETLPMWGGVLLYVNIPGASGATVTELGPPVGRATAAPSAGFAFSLFNQAHAMIQTAQSNVPAAGVGMSVNFIRSGSGARVAVACDPALASDEGSTETTQFSWDFGGQQLVTYQAAWNANALTNATYSAGSITYTTTTSHGVSVGSWFTISGVAAAVGGYNGVFKAISGTTGSTLVTNSQLVNGLPTSITASPGTWSSSGGTLVAGGGALPCRVLGFKLGNSMVPYLSNGTVNWQRSGNAALILI
jgi:hypothetical protein